jgi:putative SOS response-associated peptidase YedK
MCHRVTPLLFEELQLALDDLRVTGRARVPARAPHTVVPDAYPGTQVPLFVMGSSGELEVQALTWGFDATIGGKQKNVFNTRIETALSQASSGYGLWAQPIVEGRCLVPVRSFYESWTRSRERRGRDVRFTLPGHRVFLLAGIRDRERFSLVTTRPNADMQPIHSRMPLVLGPGESSVWLGPDFARLADRSHIRLEVESEVE